MNLHTGLPLLLFSLSILVPAQASDIAKERRWAAQLREQIVVGEPLQLSAGEQDFLAVFTPAEGRIKRGAVILLHGMGAHPDWPEVIAPLRENLPEAGWSTLSIQLPVRPNEAKFEDYPPLFPEANARISAAVRYLQQKGQLNIALVGHSLGASMGAYFLAEKAPGSEAIRAFVGIGMSGAKGTAAHTPDSLAKIAIPVLDMYGMQDLREVLDSAKARARSQTANPRYRQLAIPGADHFLRGLDATLVKRVSSWLSRVAPSAEVPNENADKAP